MTALQISDVKYQTLVNYRQYVAEAGLPVTETNLQKLLEIKEYAAGYKSQMINFLIFNKLSLQEKLNLIAGTVGNKQYTGERLRTILNCWRSESSQNNANVYRRVKGLAAVLGLSSFISHDTIYNTKGGYNSIELFLMLMYNISKEVPDYDVVIQKIAMAAKHIDSMITELRRID